MLLEIVIEIAAVVVGLFLYMLWWVYWMEKDRD